MKISVIVPVLNGGDQLRECLDALQRSTRRPDKMLVVDDGSSDESGLIALERGCQVIRVSDGPRGPAHARNVGVAEANDVDLLIFIDADVVVQAETIAAIETRFAGRPDLAALFGSYDNDPPDRSWVSLYKNLLHHFMHQTNPGKSSTFWAGCGAVRKAAFDAVGGFSAAYGRPSIEDIEFGARLSSGGFEVFLDPSIQVKHLKRWSFRGLVHTDIFCRAVPWSRLLIENRQLPNELNLRFEHRVSAIAALAFFAAVLIAPVIPSMWYVAAGSLAFFVYLNHSLLGMFARQGGLLFAVASCGLHLFYYAYSSMVFAGVWLQTMTRRLFMQLRPGSEAG